MIIYKNSNRYTNTTTENKYVDQFLGTYIKERITKGKQDIRQRKKLVYVLQLFKKLHLRHKPHQKSLNQTYTELRETEDR